MSLTSATGGGSVTPGWYTDPHDPRQLRWWSGEGWTEHVSPGAAPVAAETAAAAPVAAAQGQDVPLPSRRALRDPSTEANDATAAAEAALATQASQQQAQFAEQQAQQQAAARAQAAADAQAQAQQQVQAQQQAQLQAQAAAAQQAAYAAPQAAQQPSVPVPTLPVAPTSFLEQQGYTPLEGGSPSTPTPTPAGPSAWAEPAAPQPAAAAPQVFPLAQSVPAQSVPAQFVPAQTVPAQFAPAQVPPVETGQPNAWNQPVQPEQQPMTAQPNAWNQPVAPSQPEIVQPNTWNQPVAPVQPLAPVQPAAQGWGAPAPATDGMDSLFGTAPSDPLAGQNPLASENPQASQWGLTPTDGVPRGRQQADAVPGVAGSSTFWAWLIAISPILAAGSITYVLLATKSALTSWPFEAAVAAPFLLVLLFALADRAALLNLGHSEPRSPAWALLSAPVYLIARAGETRREDGTGTVLTLAWFISFIVAVAGIVGYGFLTHHALIAGLPT